MSFKDVDDIPDIDELQSWQKMTSHIKDNILN